VSGWGQSAMGPPAVPRAGVRPARCNASSPATLLASGHFRFFRHTGSTALGTALPCSVPVGADTTDGGDRDKWRKLAGGPPLPTEQSDRHSPETHFGLSPHHPLLQITAPTSNT
jgi:hypothetical protein